MDFLIEFAGELLGELVLEGGVSAASDRRVPKWLRALVLAVLGLFFAAVFALIAWAGVLMTCEGRIAAGICMFALDLALIILAVYKLRGILRTFSPK